MSEAILKKYETEIYPIQGMGSHCTRQRRNIKEVR